MILHDYVQFFCTCPDGSKDEKQYARHASNHHYVIPSSIISNSLDNAVYCNNNHYPRPHRHKQTHIHHGLPKMSCNNVNNIMV